MPYDWIMYIIWISIIIIAIVVEFNTGMFIGWASAISATVALIIHVILRGDYVWIEVVVFCVLWAGLWGILILWVKKKPLHDDQDSYLSLMNKEAIVITSNKDKEYGEIKIKDKIFRFKTKQEVFKINDKVIIEKIKGVTAIIRKGD